MIELSKIIKMKKIAENKFRDFCSAFDDFAKAPNVAPDSKEARELRLSIGGVKSPLDIIYEDTQ